MEELVRTLDENSRLFSEEPQWSYDRFLGLRNSFTLWVNFTGALAPDVDSRLDKRLQDHDDVKGMVVELLQMLFRNLEHGK